ncbi:MAG TPA: hypothetical protein VHA06_06965 [Candidatus Angelobacter sp.]|nr:hypothetical protein [Candidatus Angelobacter sp.]
METANQSIGSSASAFFSLSPLPREIAYSERGFMDRCITFVDCCFARNDYSNKKWSAQLERESDARYEFLVSAKAAKKAGLITCETWELLRPQPWEKQ